MLNKVYTSWVKTFCEGSCHVNACRPSVVGFKGKTKSQLLSKGHLGTFF